MCEGHRHGQRTQTQAVSQHINNIWTGCIVLCRYATNWLGLEGYSDELRGAGMKTTRVKNGARNTEEVAHAGARIETA